MSIRKPHKGQKKSPEKRFPAKPAALNRGEGKGGSAAHKQDKFQKNNRNYAPQPKFSLPLLGQQYALYGTHAVEAALQNKARQAHGLFASRAQIEVLRDKGLIPRGLVVQDVPPKALDEALGAHAVHQGVALVVSPLPLMHLEDFLRKHEAADSKPSLLFLDQVTDPHNVGAILRSAAAFNVGAVVLPKDHAVRETAVVAKSACGALDMLPVIEVTNFARAFEQVKEAGYWILGMDGTARDTVEQQAHLSPVALVMGAEGKGLRRLTAKLCDILVKLPMDGQMESLNVSNAAAIALYQLYIRQNHA